MFRVGVLFLFGALFVLSGGLVGQEPKKDDPKKDVKKDDPPLKVKGYLPPNFGKLGLSDEQKQSIYKIQQKYDDEIDKLEAKIAELKAAKMKDARGVLTADQRKKYEELVLPKDK